MDVPCGDCLECRSSSQDSWVLRLSSDLKALYDSKGFAVFLTFTYNDFCLPYSNFGFTDSAPIPCFSAVDVSKFLNKIKSFMHRAYGKNSYKYFWCSEYGKFTKRPHYHALFMLNSYVDVYKFVEQCRSYWSYGFMFPKHNGYTYVDNFGDSTTPLLHNISCACKYVCKYITKDLDFYGLPLIKRYIDCRQDLPADIKSHFNKMLPKHWQSKGIGCSLLPSLSGAGKLLDAVRNGVYNPATSKIVQLPRYYVEKLCFSHLVHVVHGEKVVVRSLIHDMSSVVREVHLSSFRSRSNSLYNFSLNLNLNTFKRYGYTLSDLVFCHRLFRFCHPDELVSRFFVQNLMPSQRWYFKHLHFHYTLEDITDFRMLLYDMNFDNLPSDFSSDDDIIRFFDIFFHVMLPLRSEVLTSRYNEYLISKKLKLIQKGCL